MLDFRTNRGLHAVELLLVLLIPLISVYMALRLGRFVVTYLML